MTEPEWLKPFLSKFTVWGVVVLFLLLLAPSLAHTGITFDEPSYMSASKSYWLYFYRIWQGHSPLGEGITQLWAVNQEHPPLAKLVSAATWGASVVWHGGELSMSTSIVSHRLAALLFASLGVGLVLRWGREAWGLEAGVYSALALVFMPRFLGHSRFLALDVPMAIMWLATAYCFWKAGRERRYVVWTGVVFGLALATKLNAFFIPIAFLGWLACVILVRFLGGEPLTRALSVHLRYRLALLSMAVLAPIVLYVIWPRLWLSPIREFGEYLDFHYHHFAIPVHYLGETYLRDVPWHYPLVMLGVTLPVSILLLTFVGITRALGRLEREPENTAFFLLSNATLAILPVALFPLKYDGIRLIMPAFPFLALLAGRGARACRRKLTGPVVRRWIACALMGLALILPGLWAHLRQAPYEYVDYNVLIGEERGALRAGMELDYWAQSYRETLPWLNQRVESIGPRKIYAVVGRTNQCELFKVYRQGDINYIKLQNAVDWIEPQAGLLSEKIICVDQPKTADYYVILSRQGMFSRRAWRQFHHADPRFQFSAEGAPLVGIYDTTAGPARERVPPDR